MRFGADGMMIIAKKREKNERFEALVQRILCGTNFTVEFEVLEDLKSIRHRQIWENILVSCVALAKANNTNVID